ncbi:MAG: hypothetical protein DRP75_02245 [Candidatus Omnitrophota bacterium]|nr:MAG: hypothetical protein DRP75_02245 [Candidatus Omnitrophota bacterium]
MQKENKLCALLIATLPPPYHGVSIYNSYLLTSKIKDVFRIVHLDISDHRSLDNLGKFDCVNLYLGIKNIFQLVIMLLRESPRLVYLSIAQNKAFLRDGAFIIITSLLSKAKIIVHNHGIFKQFYDSSGIWMKKFIDFSLRKVDVFIILGESLRYTVQRWSKSIEVLPNGIEFSVDINKKVWQKSPVVISFMSNFFRKKGIIDFLKAAKIVLESGTSNVKFQCAGSWWKREQGLKREMLRFVKDNGLESMIEFKGAIFGREKEEFLLNTDIFAFPTHYDVFGLVLLEAMAAGCAIVATRVGAIPEIIIEGKTGLLVEPQNPMQLAEAILYLIKHPQERRNIAEAGRTRYEKEFRIEANIEGLIRIFRKAIS